MCAASTFPSIGVSITAGATALTVTPSLASSLPSDLVKPITAAAGTVYLAHFAGGAGAVAILSAPDNSDAALVIANADLTGRTNRERLIKANPFLERFTVADLKVWADRKMRARNLRLTEVLADARP